MGSQQNERRRKAEHGFLDMIHDAGCMIHDEKTGDRRQETADGRQDEG